MSIKSVMPSSHLILYCPLLLLLQSFPASGSFPMSQFFASSGQRIGVSASASVLPMNSQDWFSLGLTALTPCCTRDSQESSPTPQFKSTCVCVCSPSPSQRDGAYISSDPQSNAIKSEPKNGIPSNSAILLFCFIKPVWPFTEVYPSKLYDWFNVRDRGEWTNLHLKENFNVLSLVTEKLLILLRDKKVEGRSLLSEEDN